MGGNPFFDSLRRRARQAQARIAFPEGDDPRVREAASVLAAAQLARPLLFSGAPGLVDGIEWAASDDPDRTTHDSDPLVAAARMLSRGEVDGVVAGCVTSTADVLRAALKHVGLGPGHSTLSSAFYMVLESAQGEHGVLTFTDAGVRPLPSTEELVEIAASAAEARRKVVGDEPSIAFLSYSTHGSASGPDVERVRAAVAEFQRRYPDVRSDGELQADAALVPEIRRRKAGDSPLEGAANVLVFPSLDSGNIAYKLVERLAGGTALGPILQGLAAPMNDLSRGASAEDIVLVSCITAVQGAT